MSLYRRKCKLTENFQDKIARLYGHDRVATDDTRHEGLTRTCTLQVTDACNLCCTYCYQINKKHHSMTFDIAKRYIDMLLADDKDNDYVNTAISEGLIIEFIGGEPLLEIDLIDKVTDYLHDQLIALKHPWRNKWMVSICSNGVLYRSEKFQEYIRKNKYHLSFSISVDGNKKLHDACRVFPDGSGSYDIAIDGVKHFREYWHGHMGSKMTIAPGNVEHVFEATKNLLDLEYEEIFLNCVYEEGWDAHYATILYQQLKLLADYIIDNNLFDKVYFSIFEDDSFSPMLPSDNQNWCGGTGSMLSCDWKGDLYPCIRYMESSLGDDAPPLIIGNVYDGILATQEQKDIIKCMRCVTRRSQSTDDCFYCPIARACSWCSAYNYQVNGTVDKRATYICIMHKARALANAYYWNKGFRKYAPFFRFKNWVPDDWALEIIDQDELNMLKELEEFRPEHVEDTKNYEGARDHFEYDQYVARVLRSGKPCYTNDIDPSELKDFPFYQEKIKKETLLVDGTIVSN